MNRALSLYIHIPFCQRKCHYCDFNTYAGMNHYIAPYLAALQREIANWAPALAGWRVETVFFGGGTPSLMSGQQAQELLDLCRASYAIAPDAEVTLEANPGTVDMPRLEAFRAAGVNRLSFGAQSFDPAELRWLGRIHEKDDIGNAVRMARTAGVQRVNLDLIYGLPEQPLARWQRSLDAALSLGPDHLSLYALSVEEGTPLAQWVASGRVREPDPDLAADHYLASAETLERAGFLQYEISNWANSGQECRHNLTYWRNAPYLGLGAGAHSSFGGFRFFGTLLPQDYIRGLTDKESAPHVLRQAQAIQALARDERGNNSAIAGIIPSLSPIAELDLVDAETDLSDTLILGLRLSEGISFRRVRERHGVDVPARYERTIREMQDAGLLLADDARMWLTPRGRLLSNEVFLRFLPSITIPSPLGGPKVVSRVEPEG